MAPALMRTGMNECPPLELIAAYLDQRLTERERAEVTKHLAECEDCYFVFTEAMQMRAADAARSETEGRLHEPDAPPKWWATPKIAWSSAAALAAAASLVLAIGGRFFPARDAFAPELGKLVAAVGNDRIIEGRLTGG